ncbi:MAG TPA: SdrD B-like domain-containing protein [Candidatus Paceibacterota bacterium]|nr:SdrD B-like domain-containing protein [Candidatus Paceibacterota bacterium]
MSTLRTKIPFALAGIVAAAAVALSLGTLVKADTAPAVTTTVVNGSNVSLTSAMVGTPLQASVAVASSSTTTVPTGTVIVSLYNGTSCSGTPVSQTGVALANGIAQSATTTLPAGGMSYFVSYGGDANFGAANGTCVAVTATNPAAYTPTLSLMLSSTSVAAGTYVYAVPHISAASRDATGTVQYNVYSDNACTASYLNAGSQTVTSGRIPNSASYQFNTPGTYYWQAVYTGDQYDAMATSTCTGAMLTVAATSSTPTTTPNSISGTFYNDQNGNDTQDGSEPGLSGWTVWLHSGAGYNAPITATATTDSSGHYSFNNLAAGTYFVEESEPAGWNQTSSDTKVVLNSSHTSAVVNFANMQKATTTPSGGNGQGDGDNDGDDNGSGNNWNNGNHWGWFPFHGNIGSWFHFGNNGKNK